MHVIVIQCLFSFIDLILQLGTYEGDRSSFVEDLFIQVVGGLIGAFIGVWGSIKVFRLQQKNQQIELKAQIEREEKIKSNERAREEYIKKKDADNLQEINNQFENEQLKYIYELIKGSKKFGDSFNDELISFNEKIKLNSMVLPDFELPTSNDLVRFVQNVNHQDMYRFYKKNIGEGDYLKIVHELEYIEAAKNEVTGILARNSLLDFERRTTFKTSLDKIIVGIRNITIELSANGKENTELYKELDKIIWQQIKILQEDRGNLVLMRDNVVKPILTYFFKHSDKSLKFKYLELLNEASENIKMLTPIQDHNKIAAKYLIEYSIKIKNCIQDLQGDIVPFENKFEIRKEKIQHDMP